MVKRFLKWMLVLALLIGMSSFFSYRLTLKSMGGDPATKVKDPVTNAEENQIQENIRKYKALIQFNPVPQPPHKVLKEIQHQIFYKTPEIRSIRSSITILHQELDSSLSPKPFLAMQASKTTEDWQAFTGSPDTAGGDTPEMVTRIENMIRKLNNPALISDLRRVRDLLTAGTNEYNVLKLWQAHKIVHDLDYFLLNYPVTVKTGEGAVDQDLNGPKQYWAATRVLTVKTK